MIAGTPHQGGATWAVLQYLIGLRRLGCRVHFVEPVADSAGAGYVAEVMDRFGLAGCWAVVVDGGTTIGLDRGELEAVARAADLLVNISGMLTEPAVLDHVPVRAYLDLDPAFVQLWHAAGGIDMRLDAHSHFVTLSDSVGRRGGVIPDCGVEWIPTLPPVVLHEWPVASTIERAALTSVGHWRGYGSIEHAGQLLGQRAHSVRRIIDLPQRLDVDVEVAFAIHPGELADLAALDAHGWRRLDPAIVAADPDRYRRFVQGSWGELGVAKSGYVVSDSGWFSDRSACYLASGRPVVAQSTGFERRLPTGAGLCSYATVDEAAIAVDAIARDYDGHRAAARAVAEDHLDSDRVLTSLLDRLLR